VSGSGLLAALAVLLVTAASRDLFGGLEVQLRMPKLLLGKLLGAGCGALLGVVASPVAPGRLACRSPASSSPTRSASGGRGSDSGGWSQLCPTPSTCLPSAPARVAARPPGSSSWRGRGRGRWRRSCG